MIVWSTPQASFPDPFAQENFKSPPVLFCLTGNDLYLLIISPVEIVFFREAAIAAAEEKRLKDNETPETVDEFEQLVRASPNSSFVWIKYMAFMLSIADVERARAVAERLVLFEKIYVFL